MIGAWIGIIAGLLLGVAGIVAFATKGSQKEVAGERFSSFNKQERNMFRWGGIAALLAGIIISSGSTFWLYGTEAGARAQKTFQSSTGGGLTRVVTVYDMEGDEIKRYEGKFDVDANEQRIIFDMPQPDGSYKRVQIWSSTGTVTIEEK